MTKMIKVEWCENFIRSYFKKHSCRGVYTGLMFSAAEKAGLYTKGTYDSPFSAALENTTKVEGVNDADGTYLYSVFVLK